MKALSLSAGSSWLSSRRIAFAWDFLLPIGLGVLVVVTQDSDRHSLWPLLILVLLPLVFRRYAPLPVLVVVSLGVILIGSRDVPFEVSSVALASLAVGEFAVNRTRSAVSMLTVAAALAAGFLGQGAAPLPSLVLPFVILPPAWVVGDALRGRRLDALALTEAAEREARDREARMQAAIAEERRHVARELHDVVAHGVSVMLIQAGAARQVVRTEPQRAEEALLAVEATGREAMAELRCLLGVLSDDGEATSLAPQPGIAELGALGARVREAGLPVELAIDGARRPVPTSLDVTVYRIVQEALTNALRYANRARTLVQLTYEPSQLRVEILDDGPTVSQEAIEGSGRGLVGMAERAALVGGRIEAGPRIGGGYAVRAWLPLDPEPS